MLLLGGPNLFFKGLQEAWRHHLGKLWTQRKVELPAGRDAASLIIVPAEALYYACLGCVEIGRARSRRWPSTTAATSSVVGQEGQHEQKAKDGARA